MRYDIHPVTYAEAKPLPPDLDPPMSPVVHAVEDIYKVLLTHLLRFVPLWRICLLVSAYLWQMILFAKGDQLEEWAWKMCPNFTEGERNQALIRLRSAGIITKIPGGYGFSKKCLPFPLFLLYCQSRLLIERFLFCVNRIRAMFSSPKMNTICKEAREFAERIREGRPHGLDSFCTQGGAVAHFLSLLHHDLVRLPSIFISGFPSCASYFGFNLKQVRAVPELPELPPEVWEGGEQRMGRGGLVLHLMGSKHSTSGPYRTSNLNLAIFSWRTLAVLLLKPPH